MPLFSSRGTLKSRPKKSTQRHLIANAALLLCLFVCIAPFLYFISIYSSVIFYTATVAGDNLSPTPWHHFPSSRPPVISWSRGHKIFHCSYLSCVAPSIRSWSSSSPTTPDRRVAGNSSSPNKCPDFFQWIHQDLSPWRASGISDAMVAAAREFAAFRVVIVGGQLYAELFYQCVQSRAMFTLWGLLLLLERFPGQVPDVDFMFNCMDRPHFAKKRYKSHAPPPLFAYCGSKETLDIAFPDWSFWGWAEVKIGPWMEESTSIFQSSEETSWENRKPRAHWKGNPHVGAAVRTELLTCNKTDKRDFGADIYVQNWLAEAQQGFKSSKLSDQCHHRYKLYAEGHAWSVSFKYIMACGSTLLIVNPEYHDFFMRGLLPRYHYWPIDRHPDMCSSINNAVTWGNSHPEEAEAIGIHAQEFLRTDLSMEHVYDYMLHLLREYAKLQKFQPKVPAGARLLCKNAILCIAEPEQREFLERSSSVSAASPCAMPPADDGYVSRFKQRESEGFRAVRELMRSRSLEERSKSQSSTLRATPTAPKREKKRKSSKRTARRTPPPP